jgi:YD repeat-containing protein
MPDPSTPGTSSTTDYEELTYDAGSNVTARRLRDATSIGYSYDNLGRLTERDLPATAWYNIGREYTYDNFGRLVTAAGNGTITYAYDALGRLASETTPFGARPSWPPRPCFIRSGIASGRRQDPGRGCSNRTGSRSMRLKDEGST